jgi:hypothetical protein
MSSTIVKKRAGSTQHPEVKEQWFPLFRMSSLFREQSTMEKNFVLFSVTAAMTVFLLPSWDQSRDLYKRPRLFTCLYICTAYPARSSVSLARCVALWSGTGSLAGIIGLKVHMDEIFIVCFYLFLHHTATNRYPAQYNQHFQKYFSNSPIFFESFDHSSFSPKARSKAERCCWKRKVKLIVVFKTASFRIVSCVLSESAEWNLAILVKMPSYSNRYRQKRRVCKTVRFWQYTAYSEKTQSETVQFGTKCGIHENLFTYVGEF